MVASILSQAVTNNHPSCVLFRWSANWLVMPLLPHQPVGRRVGSSSARECTPKVTLKNRIWGFHLVMEWKLNATCCHPNFTKSGNQCSITSIFMGFKWNPGNKGHLQVWASFKFQAEATTQQKFKSKAVNIFCHVVHNQGIYLFTGEISFCHILP